MRAVLIGLMLCVSNLGTHEAKTQTPKAQYEALLNEFKSAGDAWNKHFKVAAGRDSEAYWAAHYQERPGWSFPPRFLRLAEEHPKDPIAMDCLRQIVSNLGGQYLQ